MPVATTLADPEFNVDLARRVLDVIKATPDAWNQKHWVSDGRNGCETAYCFAGHTLVLSGYTWRRPQEGDRYARTWFDDPEGNVAASVGLTAQRLLGLGVEDGVRLFDSHNTFQDLKDIVEEYAHA